MPYYQFPSIFGLPANQSCVGNGVRVFYMVTEPASGRN